MSQTITTALRVVSANAAGVKGPEFILNETLESTSGLLHYSTQVVGTAAEALAIGDVTDEAMCLLVNTDGTNFVEVGAGSFTAWFKIPPGRAALIPIVSSLAAVQLKADTASCEVTVVLFKVAP